MPRGPAHAAHRRPLPWAARPDHLDDRCEAAAIAAVARFAPWPPGVLRCNNFAARSTIGLCRLFALFCRKVSSRLRHQPLLREGVADEDSRQLRDSLGALSNAIEEAVRIRRTSTDTPTHPPHRNGPVSGRARAPAAADGAGFRVAHPVRVWDYQRAFGSWASRFPPGRGLGASPPSETEHFDKFELLAWRTLGEALLLIDMYEQGSRGEGGGASVPSRSRSWWQRALRWLGR